VVDVPSVFPLAKRYNVELTEKAYPADRVYAIGKSFAASVDAALSCKPLLDALSTISVSPAPSSP
jgi:hypothetical protein